MPPNSFIGARIFIVEDELMVAMLIEDMLTDLGCHVVGVASQLRGGGYQGVVDGI